METESRNLECGSDMRNDPSVLKDAPPKFDGLHVMTVTDREGFSSEFGWDRLCTSFDDMELNKKLLRGIYAYGFEKPTAIQQRAIVLCNTGIDIVTVAESGTGKTTTSSIAVLQRIDPENRFCQAIILTSTCELAQQIKKVVTEFGDYLNVTCHALISKSNVMDDQRRLEKGVQIVVGTPQRVYDMISQGSFCTDHISVLVLDEADVMLCSGFKDQFYKMFNCLKAKTQVISLCAEMTSDVLELSTKLMEVPVFVLAQKNEDLSIEGVKEFYINVEMEERKLDSLWDLYDGTMSISQAVIFCNTREKINWLANQMRENEHTVSVILGDMSQKDREMNMRVFRCGASRVLITTDLLARVIDSQLVSLVINYDVPSNYQSYIYRIQRSSPFEREVAVISFVTDEDKQNLQYLGECLNIF